MVMPSPGVTMPTMRSPGTAPPFGANLTGKSELMPRTGIADGLRAGSGGDFSFSLPPRLFLPPMARDPFFLVIRIHRTGDVGGLHFTAPDRRHHVVDRG